MVDTVCIKVAVRIRPLNALEKSQSCGIVARQPIKEPQVDVTDDKVVRKFTYDHVFDSNYSQKDIYDACVGDILENLFKGYNVTILAYGQTGSGKTYTMGTTFNGCASDEMGVIPRAVDDIFKRLDEDQSIEDFSISCSFMELYQEQLYDLLTGKPREQSVLDIREDPNKGIVVPGLEERVVTSPKAIIDCLIKGSAIRATGATAMNAVSSRSHAIFTINLHIKRGEKKIKSKFHLVDLAGSERANKTKATGDRFIEGVQINKGLLALSKVISVLGSGTNGQYVSYRDSKLTRLLQDSLGGSSVTLMIACISPANDNVMETLSTLRYADQAKKIKNKPVVHQDKDALERNRLIASIEKLRAKIHDIKNRSTKASATKSSSDLAVEREKLEAEVRTCDQIIAAHEAQLQELMNEVVMRETQIEWLESKRARVMEVADKMDEEIDGFNGNENLVVIDKENCPPTIRGHPRLISDLKRAIQEFRCIRENLKVESNRFSMSDSISADGMAVGELGELSPDDQRKIDDFNRKQKNFVADFKSLNAEIAIKMELHRKYKIMEESVAAESSANQLIAQLEKEKSELLEKQKNVKDSLQTPKIAEQLRQQIKDLEIKLQDLKKKLVIGSKIIKTKERDGTQIKNIESQISALKKDKVTKLQMMVTESKRHEEWKKKRLNEIDKLQKKSKNREAEIARNFEIYGEQQRELKRKYNEANDRKMKLKVALERQIKQSFGKMDPAAVSTWIESEMEVILSVIEAKNSLEIMMEERGELTTQLNQLKLNKATNKTEIENVENDLEVLNAQITDLRSKVLDVDVDEKVNSVADQITTISQARDVLKPILPTVVELKETVARSSFQAQSFVEEDRLKKRSIIDMEANVKGMMKKIDNTIDQIKGTNDEKRSILLRQLYSTENNQTDNKELIFDEIDEFRIKIDLQRNESEKLGEEIERIQLKSRSTERNAIRKLDKSRETMMNTLLLDSSDSDDEISSVSAPKRQRATKSGSKVKGCSCTTRCKTIHCGCKKANNMCNQDCKCAGNCLFNESLINSSGSYVSANDNTVEDGSIQNANECTPKKIKLDIEKPMDVTTPSYPYEFKKTPFYDN